MTEREFLKNELLKSINEKLSDEGFSLNRTQAEFTKKDKDGWLKYQLIFLKRDDGWEINPSMLIRNNTVEEVFHNTSGFELKYQKGTPTIGTPIGSYINDGQQYRFYLTGENQIDEIASQLVNLFRKVAIPFFIKYNSISALDKVINEDPTDTRLTGDIFKGSKGIILAKLANRSNYSQMVDIYTKHYEKLANGFYLTEFKKLLQDLSTFNGSYPQSPKRRKPLTS